MERLKTMTILALLAALAGSIALAATGGEAEVRINARKLEDGRVEFALQQRVGGEWGERILPPSRYFPTDATVGRWLNSTPLTVSVATEGEGALEGDSPEPPSTSTSSIRTAVGEGATPSGALWAVWLDDFTDERRVFVASPTDSDNVLYEPSLVLYCVEDGRTLVGGFADLPVSDLNDSYTATIRWDSLTPQTLQLAETGEQGALVDAEIYRANVSNHDTLRVRFTGFSTTVTATLNVAAMRDAPTWANILACGN